MRRKVGELIQSKRERVTINVGYKINSVRDVDPKKVDAFAAGVTAYFILTGAHPFDRNGDADDAEVEERVLAGAHHSGAFSCDAWKTVPEPMRDYIVRCLSAEPETRPDLRELASIPWLHDH